MRALFLSPLAGMLIASVGSTQSLPVETAGLLPANVGANERLGREVDLDGDLAAIGHGYSDSQGTLTGSVYLYRLGPNGWGEEAELFASDAEPYDHFGAAVSIDGEQLAVGADSAAPDGAAYVFRRSAGVWTEEAILSNPDLLGGGNFGVDLALQGDLLVVGNPWHSEVGTYSGAAHVFERVAGVWTHRQKLVPVDSAEFDYFGTAVALRGDWILVGCPRDDDFGSSSGSVYVYRIAGGVVTFEEEWHAAQPASKALFGSALAVDGDLVLVGAEGHDLGALNAGAANLFRLGPGGWSEEAELHPSDPTAQLSFGQELDISGERALLGCFRDGGVGSTAGAAYLFERIAGSWEQTSKLLPLDAQHSLHFGYGVAASADRLLVGADQSNAAGTFSGIVYGFELLPRSGVLGCVCSSGPCGNDQPDAGCVNSTGQGARLLAGGVASLSSDTFVLRAESLPPYQNAIVAASTAVIHLPFGDGLLCLGAGFQRLRIQALGAAGILQQEELLSRFSFPAGSTLALQTWYRDPLGPCGQGHNLTSSIETLVLP